MRIQRHQYHEIWTDIGGVGVGANCLDYFLEIQSLVSLCIKLLKSHGWYHWKARNFAHLMR